MANRKNPCSDRALNALTLCETCFKKEKCAKYPIIQAVIQLSKRRKEIKKKIEG